jgi:hypothetical protein
MNKSPAELRQQSLIILARARETRADAEAARLRALKCRARASDATLSAVARIVVSKAAMRRNTDRPAPAASRPSSRAARPKGE